MVNLWVFHGFSVDIGESRCIVDQPPPLFVGCSTWNWGMSWVGLFALGGCVLIWTLPESPRWLVQEQERNQAAESLRILRHTNMIDAELDEIERQEATVSEHDVSIVTMFTSGRFRWPILTSIMLNAVQQLCGANTVQTKRIHSSSTFNFRCFTIPVRRCR